MKKNLEDLGIDESTVEKLKNLHWNIITYDEFKLYYQVCTEQLSADLLIEFINFLLESCVIVDTIYENEKIKKLKSSLLLKRNEMYLNILQTCDISLDLENMKDELNSNQKITYKKFIEYYNYLMMLKTVKKDIDVTPYFYLLSKKDVSCEDNEKVYCKRCIDKITRF